jgi:type II secretory pathway component GspD/PulD (secretin)
MIVANRIIAWFLIWSMLFQLSSGILYAADEPKLQPKKTLLKKKKVGASENSKSATENKQEAETASAPSSSGGYEKELSRLATSESSGKPKVEDVPVLSTPSQDTPWSEKLDILSPTDPSPVLAESIFGKKGKTRINLIANDVEVRAIMDHIASEYKLNIVSKSVATGNKLKTSLYDLPLETVFKVLLEQSNLTFEKKHGIIYLQDRGKGKDSFLEERFFQLKEFADYDFAKKLITSIATSKGASIIENQKKKTFFIVEYKRNLDKVEKMLTELGYLEDLDPEGDVYKYHYLSYSYVDKKVAEEIIKKYETENGKNIADDASNRYIVFDTRKAFQKMKDALSFVDVPRGQVFIDVLFVDLTRTDSDKLGVDMQVDWNQGTDTADQLFTSLTSDVTNFFSFKNPHHLTNLKVTGIKENSNSNILNNPKLMVLNNEQAVIDVTESFPYVTSENDNGVISSEIQQIPIGVQLTVTPKINAKREVEMSVFPKITVLKEVKNIVTKVIDTNQSNSVATETSSEFPITDERSIKTNVVIPSGRTLVIGGLIKESDRKAASKIPGLSRLPMLGKLFKNKNNGDDESQLYIFITPTIVRNAPVSSSYTEDTGNERYAYFPEGTIEEERLKLKKVVVESVNKEQNQTELLLAGQGEIQTATIADAKSKARELPEKSKTQEDGVDFSKFIKKISKLKQQQRMDHLKQNDVQAEKEAKEKGFDNLIQQLKEDINTKELPSTSAQVAQTSVPGSPLEQAVSGKTPAQLLQSNMKPQQSVKDEVMGERAGKIAALLQMWEKRPVDGVMDEEQQKKEEVSSKSEEENKKEESAGAPVAKVVEVKRQEEKKEPEKTVEQKTAPVVEDKIELQMFSPLDSGKFDKNKLFKTDGFGFGSVNLTTGKSKAKSSDSPKEPEAKPAETKSSENSTEAAPRKLPRKRLLKKKKLSMDMDSPAGNLSFEYHPPQQERIHEERRIAASEPEVPAVKQVTKSKAAEDWEVSFFEKDLAKVVVAEFPKEEDILQSIEEGIEAPQAAIQKPVQRQKAPVKEIRVAKPRVAENLQQARHSAAVIAEAKPKRASSVKIASPDPRTRQIFENLFRGKSEKPLPSPVKSEEPVQMVAEKISPQAISNVPEPRAALKEDNKVAKAEKEFASFLEDALMVEPQGEVAKAAVPAEVKEKKREKSKEKSTPAEKEFMDFLSQL